MSRRTAGQPASTGRWCSQDSTNGTLISDDQRRRVGYAVISALLRYPDEALVADMQMLGAAAGRLPAETGRPLGRVIQYLAGQPLIAVQSAYVATFDLKRRCCLYLSYYESGDTRRRGAALLRFAQAYRAAGLRPDAGELPDYLPMLLELAACEDGEPAATALLAENAVGIRLLLAALEAARSPYADAVRALTALLPPLGPDAAAAAARLARAGPPAELVGLESAR